MQDPSDNSLPAEFKFLLKECGFRVVDYGEKCAELVGGNLRITFSTADRYDSGPTLFWVANVGDAHEAKNRFLLESVRALVLKSEPSGDTSTAERADFLRTHLREVKAMFSCRNLAATKAALHRQGIEWPRKRSNGAAILPSAPPSYDNVYGEWYFPPGPSLLRCCLRQAWGRFIGLFR